MPKFSLQVTPAVKKGKHWEVTALATVLYGNRAPEPSEEVVFDVNGEEFQRTETHPESGTASSVMLLQPGGYVVTAYRLRARGEVRTSRFTIREENKLTRDEKKLADLKTKKQLVQAEKEFKEAKPPEPKRQLQIFSVVRHVGGLMVVFRRLGKDGKEEAGEISTFDEIQVARDGEIERISPMTWATAEDGLVPIWFPYSDRPRKVTFFFPDDKEVKAAVDVPAKPPEKVIEVEIIKPSAGERIAEAWQRGRRGELLAAKDPAKVLPLAAVVGGIAATLLAFRGPRGGGE